MNPGMNEEQRTKVADGAGFLAALDQSGGSTPGALRHYGIREGAWSSEEEMFDLIHQMRARIITSPSFDGDRVLGAILFEQTMDREIDGIGSAEYLWQRKHVVPFLKVDKGLADEDQGVRLMKPIPALAELCARALSHGVFGTKMRSFISRADEKGIAAVLDQQFALGLEILDNGLVPILEPEIDIHSPVKREAEELLRAGIVERLDSVPGGRQLMLKLSIPSEAGFYSDLIADPRVLRVVALSGGYSRAEADRLLAQNPRLIASFSRALTEGLSAEQPQAEFDAVLDRSIAEIYVASTS
jgi:fructose-bisphosphate aldolase, class I